MSALKKQQPDNMIAWPTPKSERFKYTNIAAAVKSLEPVIGGTLAFSGDAEFAKKMALKDAPDWVKSSFEKGAVGEEKYRDMILWDAVKSNTTEVFVIDVPKNTSAQLSMTVSCSPFLFVRVANGAKLILIETRRETGKVWANAVTCIDVADNALMRHVRVQENNADAVYTQNADVFIGRDASYESFTLTAGAGFSRNQIHGFLNGENGEIRLAGINLLSGTQHGDTTITIDHAAPNCRSNQTFKNIVADRAHGVFQGKVHVHQIAQQTDGYQLSNTLLLSPTAIMDTKPELEIYADDVKCSHGATTGQLDTAPLFYLRQRGLSEAQAKMLLMQAFLGPALEEIRDDDVQAMVTDLAFAWLSRRTNG
jgi:Fe-S cluster assembly protein SufD